MAQHVANTLALRSTQRQAAFLLPLLKSGISVLDCGCGPGSITCDLASHVAPGLVIGIDTNPAMIELATTRAHQKQLGNVSFKTASIYDIPFETGHFEIVFAHAIFQHISDPDRAIQEMYRVLAPGGIIALRSPDWGALLITPRDPALEAAFNMFLDVYYANGDAYAGRNGPSLLRGAGCQIIDFTVTVETESPSDLGPFAASKLTTPEQAARAACFLSWAANPEALFAQMWGETIARRPKDDRIAPSTVTLSTPRNS